MKLLVGDFETTVYGGQERTDVWASAITEINDPTDTVHLFGDISSTWDYLVNLRQSVVVYYHNLKFDGSFWLDYFLTTLKYTQAYTILNEEETAFEFLSTKEMPNYSVKYLISDMGQWYSITVKLPKRTIEFRDSLKLLPFSVSALGKGFKTKHQKTEIEYRGFRYPNCPISEQEQEYIKNDVLVIKEALEIMFAEGHKKLTIGSCCLTEFKRDYSKSEYEHIFPDLHAFEIDVNIYGSPTADGYIRNSYRGGWCYVAKGKERKRYHSGCTLDVNSLYPSMMHSESGNSFPYGLPTFWSGDYIPDKVKNNYYFFRPFRVSVQIKAKQTTNCTGER